MVIGDCMLIVTPQGFMVTIVCRRLTAVTAAQS